MCYGSVWTGLTNGPQNNRARSKLSVFRLVVKPQNAFVNERLDGKT